MPDSVLSEMVHLFFQRTFTRRGSEFRHQKNGHAFDVPLGQFTNRHVWILCCKGGTNAICNPCSYKFGSDPSDSELFRLFGGKKPSQTAGPRNSDRRRDVLWRLV